MVGVEKKIGISVFIGFFKYDLMCFSFLYTCCFWFENKYLLMKPTLLKPTCINRKPCLSLVEWWRLKNILLRSIFYPNMIFYPYQVDIDEAQVPRVSPSNICHALCNCCSITLHDTTHKDILYRWVCDYENHKYINKRLEKTVLL